MGTLASELGPLAPVTSPRVYADANLPLAVVAAMRRELHWDVFFVLEHSDVRRARDRDHYVRALDMGRTLVTLDHDFLDDRAFPPALSPGVIVFSAADERALLRLVRHVDRVLLRPVTTELPLRGRKVQLTVGDVSSG